MTVSGGTDDEALVIAIFSCLIVICGVVDLTCCTTSFLLPAVATTAVAGG